jgi:hypothetical protein
VPASIAQAQGSPLAADSGMSTNDKPQQPPKVVPPAAAQPADGNPSRSAQVSAGDKPTAPTPPPVKTAKEAKEANEKEK